MYLLLAFLLVLSLLVDGLNLYLRFYGVELLLARFKQLKRVLSRSALRSIADPIQAFFRRQRALYHIEVPSEYWEKMYGEQWYKGTDAQRQVIRENFLNALMHQLTSAESQGILTPTWIDYMGNRQGIRITRLNQKEQARKTYFRLASPSPKQDPRGFFWGVMAVLSTLMVMVMLLLFLAECRSKPAQTKPTVYTRDTIHERLQREADATVDTVAAKKKQTSQTQKPYEDALFDFDSLRAKLGQ